MPLETCLQAVSEQSEKLHVKASEWRCAAGFRKVIPCRTACANIPASLTPVLFDGRCRRKIRTSRRGAQSPGGLHRTAAASEITPAAGHAYPLVLLVVATGVVTILLTAVVPKIIEQFDHLDTRCLPSTRMLIAMSDTLQTSGVYWLAGLLGLLVLGQRLLKILRCACAGIKPCCVCP